MSGETKKRISDLEIELNELRNDNKMLVAMLADRPNLRDQFAMAALTGLLTDKDNMPVSSMSRAVSREVYNGLSEKVYLLADAMLRAREDDPFASDRNHEAFVRQTGLV